MQHQTLEGQIAALSGEVQDLRSVLQNAIKHLPKPGSRVASSGQLSQELGISRRLLLRWVSEGRLDPKCFTTKKRGSGFQYVFDRQLAIPAIEAIQRGDR